MTKEEKAINFAREKFPNSHIGFIRIKSGYIAGYEAAESNQTQLIKAALRFAKDNHNFCFTEDMMFNLFMESIDPKNIPLPPPKNK